jgi:putative nucleotidyltransferase with HDIG domain
MEIVDKILAHPQFQAYLAKNAEAEVDRLYCHHDFQHALDVARVGYCMVLEQQLPIKKEILYATALLHDIAKWKQYESGVDHAQEGALLAGEILSDIGLDEETTREILAAIRTHRVKDCEKSMLGEILYKSDKVSRSCVICPKIETCKRFHKGQTPTLQY